MRFRKHMLAALAAALLIVGYAAPASAAAQGSATACSAASSPVTGLAKNAHPVVIVHGWTGSASDMQPLRKGLEAQMTPGWQFLLFDYHQASAQWADSPAIAGCLQDYLKRVSRTNQAVGGNGQVYIVAHSMGGLAARFADSPTLLTNGHQPLPLIGGLVTLDTPHAGSPWGGISTELLSEIQERLKRVSPTAKGLPPAQSKARICLAVHDGAQGLPAGCAYAPYLPGNTPVAQVAGNMTLRRDIFGITLYNVPLSGDSIVTVPSSQGYLGSDGTYRPVGAQVGTSTISCTMSLNALEKTLVGLVNANTNYDFLFGIDQMQSDSNLMDAIQQNKINLQQVEMLILADGVKTKGNECSHANIPSDPAAIAQVAHSLKDEATYWQKLSDVNLDTLKTAQVPADCTMSSQRLVNGATPAVPDGSPAGSLQLTPNSPVFADFAHFGYKQALAIYGCTAGGAADISWPQTLILTGSNGVLLGSYDLGDVDKEEHATVDSMTVSGGSARVQWAAYEGAGFNVFDHTSIVTAPEGQLQVNEDPQATTLGIPTSKIMDISANNNPDGSPNEFTVGDGSILCAFQSQDDASTTTLSCQSGQNFGPTGAAQCGSTSGTTTIVLADSTAWDCGTSQLQTSTQWWNFGSYFPTTTGNVQSGVPILTDGRGLQAGNIACAVAHEQLSCTNIKTDATILVAPSQVTIQGQ